MNIPLSIAEKGGDTLQTYIRTQISIDDKRVRLAKIEVTIRRNMLLVSDLIGDFMPKEKNEYHHSDWLNNDNDYRTMRIIPNMYRKSSKVVLDFIATEEILKNLRPLILEMKGLEYEIAKLKRLQKLREQGKA